MYYMKYQLLNILLCLLLMLFLFMFSSCDPTYNIVLENHSKDTIKVIVSPDVDFLASHNHGLSVHFDSVVHSVYFAVIPHTIFSFGTCISDLDTSELQFDRLLVLKHNDTIVKAVGKPNIISLFYDKTLDGTTKPYKIIIK